MTNEKFTEKELQQFVINSYKIYTNNGERKIRVDGIVFNLIVKMLDSWLNKNKRYFLLTAPTGYGKTIIGFLAHYSLKQALESLGKNGNSYYLTSAKMLQDQIDKDLVAFGIDEDFTLLKGVVNYECNLSREQFEEKKKYNPDYKESIFTYGDRPCKGVTNKSVPLEYARCWHNCNYKIQRELASSSDCAVINYSYFLNVMRGEFNPFFGPRALTICDEGHLIPDTVCNFFNMDFNPILAKNIKKRILDLHMYLYGKDTAIENTILNDAFSLIPNILRVFDDEITDLKPIEKYFKSLEEMKDVLKVIGIYIEKQQGLEAITLDLKHQIERLEDVLTKNEHFKDLCNRPDDIFIQSTWETKMGGFRHIIKDMSESKLVNDYFLSKTNYCLLMSATLGDFYEYADLMGIDYDDFDSIELNSKFDFSKSPIYKVYTGSLVTSGGMYNKNIDSCIADTIKICIDLHPNEKGIIHTGNFKISGMLRQAILSLPSEMAKRFLIYENAQEKQEMVDLLIKSTIPYIIVGPSLNEGLDLKDSLGRFNILVKVPYSSYDAYAQKKQKRFSFWYDRQTIEKVVQEVGRTNRHENDYSATYLIDEAFSKLFTKKLHCFPEYFEERLKPFSFAELLSKKLK